MLPGGDHILVHGRDGHGSRSLGHREHRRAVAVVGKTNGCDRPVAPTPDTSQLVTLCTGAATRASATAPSSRRPLTSAQMADHRDLRCPSSTASGLRASRMSGAHCSSPCLPSGTLVYLPGSRVGPEYGKQQLVLADRSGRTEPLPTAPSDFRAIRVSPDGARIATEVGTADDANIYISDTAAAALLRRLTFGGRNRCPVWSADGKLIAFQSDRDGDRAIFSQSADGSGAAERLTKPGVGESHTPESWSPDGRTLLFSVTTPSIGVARHAVDGQPGRHGLQ